MIKAIIFDCFGVVYEDSFDRAYKDFGGDPDADRSFLAQLFQELGSGRIESASPAIAERLGVDVASWEKGSIGVGDLNIELLEYIRVLKDSYKIAMLSNIGSGGLERFFDTSVLDESFEVVVESAKIGFAKPHVQAFEITADKLGVRVDECIMVDDREAYLEGAKRVNMKTILFKDNHSFKQELQKLL